MKLHFYKWYFLILLFSCQPSHNEKNQPQKSRTIITTDGEIDDIDSFVRMLLYANEFHIEGLIYSSSMWHYKGDGKGTTFTSEMEMTRNLYGEQTSLRWPGETWMEDLIDAYGKVYPNLILHAEGYPTPEYLHSLIHIGNIDFEGEMEKDTEGSNFIKNVLLNENDTPIYLQAWGGVNTIARALKSIEDEYKDSDQWDSIYKKVCAKTIIYLIAFQDATYSNYISKNWSDLKTFYNAGQFWCFAYPWKSMVPKSWHPYFEGKFMGENIINNHGPLLKKYYSYGDGQKQKGDDEHIHGDSTKLENAQWGTFNKFDFISEGDSPAFFHLVDVGLDNLEHPDFGGWGGRFKKSTEQPHLWETDGVTDYNPFLDTLEMTYPQARWIESLQNDFAVRADWCVKDFETTNHPPKVEINLNFLEAKPNEVIELIGNATDPDMDKLTYQWWQYEEVDTYPKTLKIEKNNQSNISFSMPEDIKKGETIHLIFEVTDNGEFPLSRYQRVVITCK